MRIHLIAIGTRMPAWVDTAYADYSARLPPEYRLQLIEIPALRRVKNSVPEQLLRKEGARMLAALPAAAHIIALDSGGQQWDSARLARQLDRWSREGRDVALLVGGPEGLDTVVKAKAETVWSLSKLTFPHALVRVIVAEQMYRAWSLLHNHPYHRA